MLQVSFIFSLCISYALCHVFESLSLEALSLNEKCRERSSKRACLDHKLTCKKLVCFDEVFNQCLPFLDTPDLDGLICGNGKQCFEGKCIPMKGGKSVKPTKKNKIANSCPSPSHCYYTKSKKCVLDRKNLCAGGERCVDGQCLSKNNHVKVVRQLDEKCRRLGAKHACFVDERDCQPSHCYQPDKDCFKIPVKKLMPKKKCGDAEHCLRGRCLPNFRKIKGHFISSDEETSNEENDDYHNTSSRKNQKRSEEEEKEEEEEDDDDYNSRKNKKTFRKEDDDDVDEDTTFEDSQENFEEDLRITKTHKKYFNDDDTDSDDQDTSNEEDFSESDMTNLINVLSSDE